MSSEPSNNVSIINTTTNTVTASVAAGSGPMSIGNFITGIGNCKPITYTITVNPGITTNISANRIIVPNTFTPNGDGINDVFEIKDLANL